MHLTDLGWFDLVSLVVMFGTFAWIDRYAARHPYGTGHYGKMERKRRAREARRQHFEQQSGQGKARNEAVMTDMLAPLRREAGTGRASSSDAGADHRRARAGGSDDGEEHPPIG